MAAAQRRSAGILTRLFACLIAVPAFAVFAFAAPAFAAPVPASPGWTSAIDYPLPAGASAPTARIGYQSGGIATLAYLDATATLHVGTIAPGGPYEEQLSLPATTTATPTGLALAVAPDGAAVLEFSERDGAAAASSPVTYFAGYRPAGASTWLTPVTLATDASEPSGIAPLIVPAISADGIAAAAVDHLDPSLSPAGYRIDVAIHGAAAGAGWSAPAQLAAGSGQSAENAQLAFDATGDLTAAFDLRVSAGTYDLADQRLPASSGTWSSVEDIADDPGSTAGAPQLAIAPDGSGLIAFDESSGGTPTAEAVTRTTPTGPWTPPTTVGPSGGESAPIAAAVSPTDADDILLDEQPPGGGNCAAATVGSAGAGFSVPTCLSATDIGPPLSGGISFTGDDAHFAWSGPDAATGTNVLDGASWQAAASAPGGATALTTPAPALSLSELTPDGDGSVAAFWTTGAGGSLGAAAFDAAGPVMIASDVPTEAYVNQDFVMNATFADLWSGVGAPPSWSFGDGTTGAGAQVAHAYAKPGTYTATVTATDGLENPTTASFTIAIVPSPPPPPKPTTHGPRLDTLPLLPLTRGQLLVSLGDPPQWLPEAGVPIGLTVFSGAPRHAHAAALNAYIALQAPTKECAATPRADRPGRLLEVPHLYEAGHLLSATSPFTPGGGAEAGDYAATLSGVVIHQSGSVRACVWLARKTTQRGLAAVQNIQLLNGLFAASVSAVPSASPTHGDQTYTMNAISVGGPLTVSAATSQCGTRSSDPPQTVADGEVASESFAYGKASCPTDGSTFKFSAPNQRSLGTLTYTLAQASAAPPEVSSLGACELDALTVTTLAAAEQYLEDVGCRVGRLLVSPRQTGVPRGSVLEAQVDGGVAEIAPRGTAVDLVLNGRP